MSIEKRTGDKCPSLQLAAGSTADCKLLTAYWHTDNLPERYIQHHHHTKTDDSTKRGNIGIAMAL